MIPDVKVAWMRHLIVTVSVKQDMIIKTLVGNVQLSGSFVMLPSKSSHALTAILY